jgi:hypothetical protein
MATQSPEHGSRFDSDAWNDIVELADQLDVNFASGRPVDRELALQMARAILALEDGYPCSEIHLRITARSQSR